MNLTSVVEFMAENMEPLEIVVHPLSGAKRRLLLQPIVVAPAEFRRSIDGQPALEPQIELQRNNFANRFR